VDNAGVSIFLVKNLLGINPLVHYQREEVYHVPVNLVWLLGMSDTSTAKEAKLLNHIGRVNSSYFNQR
jgi:hypothetical protein